MTRKGKGRQLACRLQRQSSRDFDDKVLTSNCTAVDRCVCMFINEDEDSDENIVMVFQLRKSKATTTLKWEQNDFV